MRKFRKNPIIPIKEIILHRAEGPSADCVKKTADSWGGANTILRDWARTAPEYGHGYDKVDFKVTWADGEVYDGRYDMTRTGEDDDKGQDLQRHIRDFLSFGVHKLVCPYWIAKGITEEDRETAKEYVKWALKYLDQPLTPYKKYWCDNKYHEERKKAKAVYYAGEPGVKMNLQTEGFQIAIGKYPDLYSFAVKAMRSISKKEPSMIVGRPGASAIVREDDGRTLVLPLKKDYPRVYAAINETGGVTFMLAEEY